MPENAKNKDRIPSSERRPQRTQQMLTAKDLLPDPEDRARLAQIVMGAGMPFVYQYGRPRPIESKYSL